MRIAIIAVVILIFIGLTAFLFQDRIYTMLAGESFSNGVVISFKLAPANDSSLTASATVKLNDGTIVSASVIPDCKLVAGDTVKVRVIQPIQSSPKHYNIDFKVNGVRLD